MKRVAIVLSALAGVVLICGALAVAEPRPQVAPTAPPPTEPVDPAGCVTEVCHANIKQHQTLHGPVSVNACDACHTLVDPVEHLYELARPGPEMCTFCHDLQIDEAMVVHEPLRTGDCTKCHDPHGGVDRKFLRAASASALCGQCHIDVAEGMAHVHGPVAAGACAACHEPHASTHPNLLQAEGPDLCNGCHVTTKKQLETLRVVHGPVASSCQTCHNAHASNHEMMLVEDPETLCLDCHERIRNMVETATEQHAAVTTERSCLNCHEPHASDYPRVLRSSMTELCFECHDREIEMPDGRKLGNIKKVIETGTSLHGPVAQDNCAACHEIHGGSRFRLLVKEYPPEFYAGFEEEKYALCFSCHDKEVFENPETTTLTDFRNGDLNLHYLHVNRKKKGRTCRACHETHASQKEKHIRETVPFGTGGWLLPIRFEKTETGGSCAPGCHVKYAYDRENPVQYGEPDHEAKWPDVPRSSAPGAGGQQ
jgi:predicted CXXCH cytochrome family protein